MGFSVSFAGSNRAKSLNSAISSQSEGATTMRTASALPHASSTSRLGARDPTIRSSRKGFLAKRPPQRIPCSLRGSCVRRTSTRVPPSKGASLDLAGHKIGRPAGPPLISSTRAVSSPLSQRLLITRTTSPNMKTEKNPMPKRPIGRIPDAAKPGNSSIARDDCQNDVPKSNRGPVRTCSDIPIPLSSTTSQFPSSRLVMETFISPQVAGLCWKRRRAWTASAAF